MGPGGGGQDVEAHLIESGGGAAHELGDAAVAVAGHHIFVALHRLGQVKGVELQPVMAFQPAVLAVLVQPGAVPCQLVLVLIGDHTVKFGVQGKAEQVIACEKEYPRQQYRQYGHNNEGDPAPAALLNGFFHGHSSIRISLTRFRSMASSTWSARGRGSAGEMLERI